MQTLSLHTDLTIIILAGGKSSRMGQDKGHLKYANTSFVDRVVHTSKRFTANVLVSVGRDNAHLYTHLNVATVTDEKYNLGPLAGIVSCLKQVQTPWFMLLSVDSPMVSVEALETLWANKKGFEAVVYESQNRIHPLIGLYNSSTQLVWQQALNQNKLRLTALAESLKINRLSTNSELQKAIQNINTPQELAALNNNNNSMKIKVLYFGMIAEWKTVSEEMRTLSATTTFNELVQQIALEIPEIKDINYAVAHNQSLVDGNFELNDGDEVSLFPPFAGG